MTDSAARVAGLHLVTDSALCGPRGVLAVVEAAVRGGVRVVQLREKTLATRAFVERARALKALLAPRGRFTLATWAGGAERSEFLRQSALLSNIWTGFGISTANHVAPDRHHFNVLDALEKPESALTRALLSV